MPNFVHRQIPHSSGRSSSSAPDPAAHPAGDSRAHRHVWSAAAESARSFGAGNCRRGDNAQRSSTVPLAPV